MAGKNDAGKGSGLMDLILPLGIVTIVGGVGGGLLGASILPQYMQLRSPDAAGQTQTGEPGAGEAHGDAHGGAHKPSEAAPAALEVREVPPIVTNLSGAGKQLIRLQSAILYDPKELKHVDALLASLRADFVSFLGTLEVSAVEGPDGLRRLQEELRERAATRAEGHIRELIIETLVIQ